jgi:hypothetical protein
VIKVPLAAPQNAKVVSSPRVFIDPRTGVINSLQSAAPHGTGKATDTVQCHDNTVYSALGLAAGACSGNGLLLDFKDPVKPKRIDAVNDPNYAYWHSASFSNDGTKVVFTDEWGGGGGPRCRTIDPNVWGADSVFHLKDNKLHFAGYYKMPAAQTEQENCVAHNGSLIPVPGRDIMVQAWYQGGVSVFDFTDAAHPKEIAFFDRGPIDTTLVLGGFWSAYWYNGHIYGSEIARGLDVFDLQPSEYLSQNEIDAARSVHLDFLNVQNQPKIEWPASFAVARAYLDQLERNDGIAGERRQAIAKTLDRAERMPVAGRRATLSRLAAQLRREAAAAGDPSRVRSLASSLDALARSAR